MQNNQVKIFPKFKKRRAAGFAAGQAGVAALDKPEQIVAGGDAGVDDEAFGFSSTALFRIRDQWQTGKY